MEEGAPSSWLRDEARAEVSVRAPLRREGGEHSSPTTVVTEVNAFDSILDAQRRILGALNALDDDGQLIVRDFANPSDVIPVELRVDVAEHGGSERGGGRSGGRSGSGGGTVREKASSISTLAYVASE
jgi:hypothetical protein